MPVTHEAALNGPISMYCAIANYAEWGCLPANCACVDYYGILAVYFGVIGSERANGSQSCPDIVVLHRVRRTIALHCEERCVMEITFSYWRCLGSFMFLLLTYLFIISYTGQF